MNASEVKKLLHQVNLAEKREICEAARFRIRKFDLPLESLICHECGEFSEHGGEIAADSWACPKCDKPRQFSVAKTHLMMV